MRNRYAVVGLVSTGEEKSHPADRRFDSHRHNHSLRQFGALRVGKPCARSPCCSVYAQAGIQGHNEITNAIASQLLKCWQSAQVKTSVVGPQSLQV
jgi:hypothetical protein